MMGRQWFSIILSSVLFAIGAAAWAFSAVCLSPVWQEPAPMLAGVQVWKKQMFDVYCVNPPLSYTVTSFPIMLQSPNIAGDAHKALPRHRMEFYLGCEFLEQNSDRARSFMVQARLMNLLFYTVLFLALYCISRKLYGEHDKAIPLILFVFSPFFMGHGATIMPDVPSAALAVVSVYCFWHWLQSPNAGNAFFAGLTLGLAELTKFTLLIFYPLFPLLWILCHFSERKKISRQICQQQLVQLAGIFAVSILVINMGYVFEDTGKTLGSYQFQTALFTGCDSYNNVPTGGANRFADTILGKIPMPLPANFIQGIDTQRLDFERGLPSYLRGEWSDHGWWYFYLYALLLKTPLGTLGLFALAVYCTFFIKETNASWRDEMVVLLPGIVILAFVSSQTGFSIHSRYAIPALPFFFIWMSKVGKAISWQRPVFSCLVALLLLWSVGSSLWVYPHSISYFNELAAILPTPHDDEFPIPQLYSETDPPWAWNRIKQTLNAGPLNGPRHLLDSNIDWGQDLFYLERWCKDHPEITDMRVACWGSYPMSLTTIPDRGPPPANEPQPGWYALSVNYLFDHDGQYRYFLKFKPVALVGYSIYVYHITTVETQYFSSQLSH